MKRALPITIVFIVTFAAVFLALWLGDQDDPGNIEDSSGSDSTTRPKDDFEGAVPAKARRRKSEPRIKREPMKDTDKVPTTGILVVRATLSDGLTPGELVVVARRNALDPTETGNPISPSPTEGGVQFVDLDPGRYSLSLGGGDLVTIGKNGIGVRAGEITTLEFDMERGVRPKGRVMDATTTGRPIPGAMVEFNGEAAVFTGDDGEFEVTHAIPRRGLHMIRVESVEYDAQNYKFLTIPDPRDMTLYLGGQDSVITAEIVNNTGLRLPDQYTVELQATPGVWETKREITVFQSRSFQFENLYPAQYRMIVRFGDSRFPILIKRTEIMYTEEKKHHFIFRLDPGAHLTGKFVGPENFIAGLTLELRTKGGGPVARTTTARDGAYELHHIPTGDYFVHVSTGPDAASGFFLPQLTVADGQRLKRDVDVLRHRWK